MPVQKTVTLYHFEELAEEAKEVAREKWREHNDRYFDAEAITEMLQDQAEYLYRIAAAHIYWSAGYCQSDYLCFDGAIDILADAEDRPAEYPDGLQPLRRTIRHLYLLGRGVQIAARDRHHGSMIVETDATYRVSAVMPSDVMREIVWDWYPKPRQRPVHVRTMLDRLRRKHWNVCWLLTDWFQEYGHDVVFLKRLLQLVQQAGQEPGVADVDEWVIDTAADELEQALQEQAREYLRDAAGALLKLAYEEIEYRASDEVIDELFNDWGAVFDEDGVEMNCSDRQ